MVISLGGGNPEAIYARSKDLLQVHQSVVKLAETTRNAASSSNSMGDNAFAIGSSAQLNQLATAMENVARYLREGGETLLVLYSNLRDLEAQANEYEWALCALPESEHNGVPAFVAMRAYDDLERQAEAFRRQAAKELQAASEKTLRTSTYHPRPGMWDHLGAMVLDGSILQGGYDVIYGIVIDGGWGLVKGVGEVGWWAVERSPARLLVDPGGYVEAWRDTGETAKAVASAAWRDPGQFLTGVGEAIINRDLWEESPGRWIGAVTFDVGAAILTAGAAKGVKVVDTAGDAGAIGKALTRLGELEGTYPGISRADELIGSLGRSGRLPDEFLTKEQALSRGWRRGDPIDVLGSDVRLGGSRFYNNEKLLPDAPGREWFEADLSSSGSRGAERMLYSNDGLVYYTPDHYDTMVDIGRWK